MPPRKKKQIEEVPVPLSKEKTNVIKNEEKKSLKSGSNNWVWSENSTLIYGDSGSKPGEKILAFDMDDTLIKTKSGAKFAKDEKDWVFWHDKVPSKVKEWYDKGYKIVIFTNQAGISKGHTKSKDIKNKIEKICQEIGVPIQALIASADDTFRKPGISLWKFFANNMNGSETIKIEESIFCGDAAGRSGKKKDFSDTDLYRHFFFKSNLISRKFALNVGLKFQTPEKFFLGEQEKIPVPEFNPKNLPKTGPIFQNSNDSNAKNSKGAKESLINYNILIKEFG